MRDSSRILLYALLGGIALFALTRRRPRRGKKYPPVAPCGYYEAFRRFGSTSSNYSIIQYIYEQTSSLGPVFCLRLPQLTPFVVVCDPALVKVVLEGEENVPTCEKVVGYHVLDRITLDCPSMFSKKNSKEGWDWARKGVAHNFSNKCLAKQWTDMSRCLQALTLELANLSKSGIEFSLKNLMDRFTLDFMGMTMFRQDFRALEGSAMSLRFLDELSTAMTEFGQREYMNSLRHYMFWKRDVQRAKEATAYLESFVSELLDRYMVSRNDGLDETDDTIIGHLLQSPYSSDKELEADVLCLLVAGVAHTCNTLTWTLLEMTRHPAVLQRLREEIRQTFVVDGEDGADFSKPRCLSKLLRMEYLDCVVNESMRLWPVAAMGVFREASVHLKYGDWSIPRQSTILIPYYALFRWGIQNPEAFQPERWLEGSNEVDRLRSYCLPFGAGPRNCVGQNLALMQVKLALVAILQQFELSSETSELDWIYLMSLQPKESLVRSQFLVVGQ